MPDKKSFIPPSDKLGDLAIPDQSPAQMKSVQRETTKVEDFANRRFEAVLQKIVDQLPQDKTLPLEEFDQIIVAALKSYFEEKGFFKTTDSKGSSYSKELLRENQEKVVAFTQEFADFMQSKNLVANPAIKADITRAIAEIYQQQVGLTQAAKDIPPEQSNDQPKLEVVPPQPGETLLSKEAAAQYLARLSDIYRDLIAGTDSEAAIKSMADIAQDALASDPSLRLSFLQYLGRSLAQAPSSGNGPGQADLVVESAGPYDKPPKLLFLLVTMISALSTPDQETRSYFFDESDPATLKIRRDIGLVNAVSKLDKIAAETGTGLRFESLSEANFLTPKQDRERQYIKKLLADKPVPGLSKIKSGRTA